MLIHKRTRNALSMFCSCMTTCGRGVSQIETSISVKNLEGCGNKVTKIDIVRLF